MRPRRHAANFTLLVTAAAAAVLPGASAPAPEQPLSAAFELAIDAPVRLRHSAPLAVTWFALPLSELYVRVAFVGRGGAACGAARAQPEDSGALAVAAPPPTSGCPTPAVRIGVPFHALERHQRWAELPAGSTERTTACSNGLDVCRTHPRPTF